MGHHREFAQCAGRLHGAKKGSLNAAGLHQKSHELENAVAENQIGHLLLERKDFQIRLTERGATEESDALIYRMYTQRGYKLSSPAAALQATNEITLQACRDSNVFGTLSVRFDSQRGSRVSPWTLNLAPKKSWVASSIWRMCSVVPCGTSMMCSSK
jgi:hypothetical protein